jgi:hypothetical protein
MEEKKVRINYKYAGGYGVSVSVTTSGIWVILKKVATSA